MKSTRSNAKVADLREVKRYSFIYELTNALTPAVCSDMIDRFEGKKDQQYQGRIGQNQIEERSLKTSVDLRISGRAEWKDIDDILFLSLSKALNEISSHHPYFAANSFKDVGYNMQRTKSGEFYHWHVDGGPGEFSQRQLVAIWYLNDVKGPGGETEFLFQEVKITPQAGKLVLFPPFWTHVHRGVTLERGVKYLATTWVCFNSAPPDLLPQGEGGKSPWKTP